MIVNKVALITGAQFANSKLQAGNNNLPDWIVNSPVGNTLIGTPYYDSVKFTLDALNESDEYINTVIAVSNSAQISQTYVNGRRGSVKQMINESDYDIAFNIKITSPFTLDKSPNLNYFKQQVGKGNITGIAGGIFQAAGQVINDPLSVARGDLMSVGGYQGDYTPDLEMYKLLNVINTFYNNTSYANIKVDSLYLNNVFGIKYIVPYSVQTQQDPESTNTYNIVINAYSDIVDNELYESEIIPR